MEQREKLLEEREQIKKEYNKRQKIWMDAFNKKNELLPKSQDLELPRFVLTTEYLAEFNTAEKEEREASAKLRVTLEKLWEINAKLQS